MKLIEQNYGDSTFTDSLVSKGQARTHYSDQRHSNTKGNSRRHQSLERQSTRQGSRLE